MTSDLTKNELLFLIIFIFILFIDSSSALVAFYRNYLITHKITPYVGKHDYIDRIRMHITDTIYLLSIFICSYFLMFKNLSDFFRFLLFLLIVKSISHLILAFKVYNLFIDIKNPVSKNFLDNWTLINVISGHILSLILCLYVFTKL